MKNTVDVDPIAKMAEVYSNMSYKEFAWILSELQRFPTNFAKRNNMSPTTLKKYGEDKNNELPLFIVRGLAELCGDETQLKYLRYKYSQRQVKKCE